jgi:8-oxo-dGTP pyrophosphatase MutT (NUDIX family)
MSRPKSRADDLIQGIRKSLKQREVKRVVVDAGLKAERPLAKGLLTKGPLTKGSLTKGSPSASASVLVRAGVLLPLFCKDGSYHILFTRRTDKVKRHKGEISFPGGIYDAADRDLSATALREAHEEIGLKPRDVELLGELDEVMTLTDFIVSPFVGLIPFPYPFIPSAEEIAEIIILPLFGFLKEGVLSEEDWAYGEKTAKVHTYYCGGHVIWGATAKILRQFLELIPVGRIRR